MFHSTRLGAATALGLAAACSVGDVPETTSLGPPTLTSANPTGDGDGDGSDGTGPSATDGGSGTGMVDDSGGSDTVGPPCGDATCDANATCEGGTCVCEPGYEGDGIRCADIDGCAANPCPPGVECTDVPAPGEGHACGGCPPGTESSGADCIDIDGCAEGPCAPGVECTDVPAPSVGFTCGDCPTGTEGDGIRCADIDGCAAAPCFAGVTCTDVPAPGEGFSCGACPAGTFGDGIDCLAPQQYELGDQSNSGNLGPYFRANGYVANADGFLGSFEVYMNAGGACSLDFYVFEAASPGGALTQVWRNTVAGVGLGFQASGPIGLPITSGMYYALGVGWNCTATYYWNSNGAYTNFDAGIGLFTNTRWDNAYPGPSDLYVPPNIGPSGTTTYRHRVYYAE